jgi:hypothetical protein
MDKIVERENHHAKGLGTMDFGARNGSGQRRQQQQQQQRRQPPSPVDDGIDPVKVVLGIREELAEFRRNGGKQALRAKWRAACEEALVQTMRDPVSFEAALSEPGGIIEYLRDRGVIPPAPSRWPVKAPAVASPRRRRRRRDAENG